MNKALAVIGPLAATALVLAGCGGHVVKGSGSPASHVGSSAPSTSTASSPAGSPSAPASSVGASSPSGSSSSADPATTAKLAAINLVAADFPAGYTSTPSSDNNSADDQGALVKCVGGRDTSSDQTDEVDSPDFSDGAATISSNVSSYRTQADIDADVAIISSPKIDGCYQQLLRGQLGQSIAGATINTFTVHIVPGSAGGPANVVGTGVATIDLTVSGQSVVAYVNLAFITGHLTEAEVDFENVGAPVAPALRSQLIAKVAERAAR